MPIGAGINEPFGGRPGAAATAGTVVGTAGFIGAAVPAAVIGVVTSGPTPATAVPADSVATGVIVAARAAASGVADVGTPGAAAVASGDAACGTGSDAGDAAVGVFACAGGFLDASNAS